MIKFVKKHPYLIIGYITLACVCIGFGLRENASDGFILFGVGAAILTGYSWIVNEE